MLRSALLILSGSAATSLLLFGRNLAVAALIPVEDYGIAATFALAMAAVEMASTLGLQQQIVQAKDGEDPKLQDALQGFQVFRGIVAAVVLVAVAHPLAAFLRIAEVAWAYQVLALVPVMTALQHFDIHRLNRSGHYLPMVATGAVPALAALLIVWPLAHWLGDWRVMLIAILVQHVGAASLSHLVAQRRYRLSVDLQIWRRSFVFGWPLLVNAMILFAVFQGDKLLVGRLLGMEVLGVFAMAVTLTLTPSFVLDKTVQTTFLPKLSAAQGADIGVLVRGAILWAVTLGALLAAGGVLVAPMLAPFLANSGYAALPLLIGPLAVMQGLRICKSGTGVVALSQGLTSNAAIANGPRLLALVVGWAVVSNGGSLLALIWIGCVAEACGFALSMTLLRRRASVPFAVPLASVALASIAFVAAVSATALPQVWGIGAGVSLAAAIGLALRAVRHGFLPTKPT
ncbi:MAG: oligosaccharide flippase family protein [Pseudomonadota bacterium]